MVDRACNAAGVVAALSQRPSACASLSARAYVMTARAVSPRFSCSSARCRRAICSFGSRASAVAYAAAADSNSNAAAWARPRCRWVKAWPPSTAAACLSSVSALSMSPSRSAASPSDVERLDVVRSPSSTRRNAASASLALPCLSSK